MKKCCICKIEKPLDEFGKNSSSKDGLRSQCKSCNKAYREANKGKIAAYCQANKEKKAEYDKAYKQANREKIAKKLKAYREANKEKIAEYQRNRRKDDPLFKLKGNLRNRMCIAFKRGGYRKTSKTQEMLGVDWEVASAHIERQFAKGMSWDNQGEWHIDHIIPLSSAKTEAEIKKLCHYSNLQPLWGKDNISKGGNVEHGTQSKLRI